MYLVGLTGGIATGKSTVSAILQQHGCRLIDADVIAREALDVGSSGYYEVKKQFGSEVISADGSIDRQKLAAIIFTQPNKRRVLNSIVHPYVRKMMLWKVVKAFFQGYRYVILDVPLLIESQSFLPILGEVIVVYCNPETQLSRLMSRNNYTEEEAQARMNSQLSIEDKKRYATNPLCLIDNSEDMNSTRSQVLALKQYLDSSWKGLRNKVIFVALIIAVPLFVSLLSRRG